jgi:hypothetical protein
MVVHQPTNGLYRRFQRALHLIPKRCLCFGMCFALVRKQCVLSIVRVWFLILTKRFVCSTLVVKPYVHCMCVCVCVCRQREVGAKLWIEQILSISLPPAYIPLLCDGVILCKLMSAINEKWIPKIYEPFGKMNKVPLFHTKKNLTFFLGACEEELLLPAYVEPNTPPLVHSSCNSDGCK